MSAALVATDFTVGQLVWVQLYSPVHPAGDSTIEERIAHGKLYGIRRLSRLAGIVEHYNSRAYAQEMGAAIESKDVTRYWTVDPDRPNDASRMSWFESDWCVIEDASGENGMLW
jgi:hypothetical protein